VYVIPALGGAEQRIGGRVGSDWSPDGKTLVVGLWKTAPGAIAGETSRAEQRCGLPLLAGGLGPTQIAPTGGTVRFSRDGKWLYATAEKSPTESKDVPMRGYPAARSGSRCGCRACG